MKSSHRDEKNTISKTIKTAIFPNKIWRVCDFPSSCIVHGHLLEGKLISRQCILFRNTHVFSNMTNIKA